MWVRARVYVCVSVQKLKEQREDKSRNEGGGPLPPSPYPLSSAPLLLSLQLLLRVTGKLLSSRPPASRRDHGAITVQSRCDHSKITARSRRGYGERVAGVAARACRSVPPMARNLSSTPLSESGSPSLVTMALRLGRADDSDDVSDASFRGSMCLSKFHSRSLSATVLRRRASVKFRSEEGVERREGGRGGGREGE